MESPAPRTGARIEEGLAEAARLLPTDAARPNLRWWALRDPSNLLIAGVVFAAGIGHGPWWLAGLALLGEGAWLAAAPRLPGVRRALLDRARRDAAAREQVRRTAALAGLGARDRARIEALLDVRAALAERARTAAAPRGELLLAALAKVDALLGLGVLEARRAAELAAYLEGLDPEQIERDRRRLERDGGVPAALEEVRQRAARARSAQAGLEASRTRIAELEAALRNAALPAEDVAAPQPSLAELLAGVDAVVAATAPEAPAGSWRALMQRTPS